MVCADLTESTQMHLFKEHHPGRFIEVGVAEQIKTTACLNDRPVKVVGSHADLNVGPDGGTHQMLEDIALMRVLPNMVVIAPADSRESEAATKAIARDSRPAYLRLARDATDAVFDTCGDFIIGDALPLRDGGDVGIVSTGTMTREALDAANILHAQGIEAAVLHVPTIKPLDESAIVALADRTNAIVTIEEAQRVGSLGSAVTEILAQYRPTRVLRLGVDDRFSESGPPKDELSGLTGPLWPSGFWR